MLKGAVTLPCLTYMYIDLGGTCGFLLSDVLPKMGMKIYSSFWILWTLSNIFSIFSVVKLQSSIM